MLHPVQDFVSQSVALLVSNPREDAAVQCRPLEKKRFKLGVVAGAGGSAPPDLNPVSSTNSPVPHLALPL